MAGGKETPRQKMIGIMYLVLLALLALQVSSAIINKFLDINNSLEYGIVGADERNQEVLKAIEKSVKDAQNNKKDMAVYEKAKLLREKTVLITTYLNKQKEKLIEVSGGKNEDGSFPGAKEEEPVMNYMLGSGESKNGEAYTMKNRLNNYVKDLNALAKELGIEKSFELLAKDAKDDPRFQNDSEQKNKDFAQLNFESTPMVAALAVISEIETRILNMESELLVELGGELNKNILKVDKIRPVVRQNAEYVVAGTDYEAEMFMAAYSSKISPKMTFNENDVEVDGEGVGSIKFKASGGAYDRDGKVKKTWKGSISFPKASGGDTTYYFEQDYYVVQPAITVQAASVQTLYRNCGNKLSFQVPALGANYSPTITATGASVIKGAQPGDVVIVPTSPNIKVNISNNGTFVGSREFRVKLVPTPTISVNLNQRRPEHISRMTRLRINADMPSDFKAINPSDAICQVTKYKAYLIRNNRVVIHKDVDGNSGGALSSFVSQAKDGDRLMIEIKQVQRRTYRGGREIVNIPDTIFNIPLKE